jgi:hypothetical protein
VPAVPCPQCGLSLNVPEALAAGKVKCSFCGLVFQPGKPIPYAAVAAPEPAPRTATEPDVEVPSINYGWLASELWPYALIFGVVTALVAASEAKKGSGVFGSIVAGLFIMLLFMGGHFLRPKCAACESRWSKKTAARWVHQRQDGGPDMRYKDNPLIPASRTCLRCGHQWYLD